jgi:hypothetical protein
LSIGRVGKATTSAVAQRARRKRAYHLVTDVAAVGTAQERLCPPYNRTKLTTTEWAARRPMEARFAVRAMAC